MSADHLSYCDQEQKMPVPAQHSYSGSEYALWKSFKAGDIEAYAVIYSRYFFILYQYGKKITHDHELVKDSIQDLFIKIWNNRETLNETSSIKYYLLTSLKRKLLDTLRSPQSRMESDHELLESNLFAVEDMEEDEISLKKAEVLKALNNLSGHQQKLLHLKFHKNYSNQEIAQEMGITIQSVYNAVFKTLKSLRNQLSILVSAFLIYF